VSGDALTGFLMISLNIFLHPSIIRFAAAKPGMPLPLVAGGMESAENMGSEQGNCPAH
jgi:hypothetical protein